jgi:hypothetical protein
MNSPFSYPLIDLPDMQTANILIYDDNEALRISMEALITDHEDLNLLAAKPSAKKVIEDIRSSSRM